MPNRRTIVLVTIGLLLVGVVVSRRWHDVGIWFTISVIALYLLSDLPATIGRMAGFRNLSAFERLKLFSSALMLALLVSAIVSGAPLFFLLLINLVFELFYYERR
jgi:hypothetical protein